MNQSKSTAPWTGLEIETLTRDWLSGKSATLIGRVLNRSRCSICSKVRRLGLPLGTAQRIAATRRPPSAPKSKQSTVVQLTSEPVPLSKLRSKDCHALIDSSYPRDPLFCGRPCVRLETGKWSSYCVEHHQLFCKQRLMP
jgi:hypothetical protein